MMLQEKPISAEALQSKDPDRVCPIFAGPMLIEGDSFTIRTPSKEISIEAENALLRRIFDLCDGTRSITELLSTLPQDQKEETSQFFAFLLDNGALVDAATYVQHAMRYGWGNSPFGQPASDDLSASIAHRFSRCGDTGTQELERAHSTAISFSPLQELLSQRVSTYHYGQDAIPQAHIDQMLWCMCGVTCDERKRSGHLVPRRTIPSAGTMHLVTPYIAILQETSDGLSPGIYRATFPSHRKVSYELVNEDVHLLSRCIAKPWLLTRAAGMIFLIADADVAALRYRNRSVQYLYTEAGMALQNAALSSAEQGIGFVSFGSYYEGYVQEICKGLDHLVLGSAIFGSLPKNDELLPATHAASVDFAWADTPSDSFTLPFFVARAKLKHSAIARPTWGRDVDPKLAWRKAIAETIERKGYTEPPKLKTAAFRDLEVVIDPRKIARFSDKQYSQVNFAFTPFSETEEKKWAFATRITDGQQVAVLGELVYAMDALRRVHGQTSFYWKSNSSGCAAGTTMADAQLAGTLELIERDAFMRHWFAQKPGIGIHHKTLPQALRTRIAAIQEAGCDIQLQLLPSNFAPVAFLFAQNTHMQFSTVAAGARLTLSGSIESALVEMESRVFSLLNGHNVGRPTPHEVLSPDDHFAIYAHASFFQRADALKTPKSHVTFEEALAGDLDSPTSLYDGLILRGITPLFCDITPVGNGIPGSSEKLAAVRAFAPGLLPMTFGYGIEPHGMVSAVHPDSLFPHPFP